MVHLGDSQVGGSVIMMKTLNTLVLRLWFASPSLWFKEASK